LVFTSPFTTCINLRSSAKWHLASSCILTLTVGLELHNPNFTSGACNAAVIRVCDLYDLTYAAMRLEAAAEVGASLRAERKGGGVGGRA
jgi:hypothetical protein